jgi:hypothetical protein
MRGFLALSLSFSRCTSSNDISLKPPYEGICPYLCFIFSGRERDGLTVDDRGHGYSLCVLTALFYEQYFIFKDTDRSVEELRQEKREKP